MKKITKLLAIISLIFNFNLDAQTPQSFSYQAVVRDAQGNIVQNQNVSFRFSIIETNSTGNVVYVETQQATTNNLGLVVFSVGNGVVQQGVFSTIQWGASLHFLKIELDVAGGSNYVDMGTTELLSVPYAFHANIADNAHLYNAGSGISLNNYTFSHDAHSGDVTGSTNITVTGLQGTPLSSNSPSLNQVLQYDGSNWLPVASSSIISAGNGLNYSGNTLNTVWTQSGNDIFNNNAGRVGIGLNTPSGKVTIQGDTSNVLFEVRDRNGIPVFVVYQDSVQVFVSNLAAKTNKGSFAVNAKSQTKAGNHNIFRVVPDSLVEIKDANGIPVFQAFQDSVQVFVDATAAKTNKGSFAVNAKSQSKAVPTSYLRVAPDSSRIYTEDPSAGFGVRDLSGGSSTSYMNLTPENYFIGHEAGIHNTGGLLNSFIGYNAGFSNINGSYNIYIGNKSGYSGTLSNYCTFLGYEAGKTNESSDNTFIGYVAGQRHRQGGGNVYIGSKAGQLDTAGSQNIFIGEFSGQNNTTGHNNVFEGFSCGVNNATGSFNVFLGNEAGRENTDGNRNIAVGCNALMNNTAGENNVALGFYALSNNVNGFNNIAFGNGSLSNNKSGNTNIGVGQSSLFKMKTGSNNIGIGYATMMNDSAGSYNVSVGDNAMIFSFGNGNVAIGNASINKNIGNNNTAVGNVAFNNSGLPTNFDNSTAIGYYSEITASNQVRIGNALVTSIGGFADWSNVSDKRFKKDINENVPGLTFIMKLKPVTYRLDMNAIAKNLNNSEYLKNTNDIQMLQTGFIAQDVEKAAQELGFEFSGIDKPKNKQDFYGLRYAEFTVPLVKAVQEQQLQIEQLKLENQNLKEELQKIKEKLEIK